MDAFEAPSENFSLLVLHQWITVKLVGEKEQVEIQ